MRFHHLDDRLQHHALFVEIRVGALTTSIDLADVKETAFHAADVDELPVPRRAW